MPKTIQNYTNERNELLQKMFNILGISKENNMISLKKMDENIELQNQILELIPDIKKFFLCSRWSCFNNTTIEVKRVYLSLIKYIMKDMNIKINSATMKIKTDNDLIKCETFYYINI